MIRFKEQVLRKINLFFMLVLPRRDVLLLKCDANSRQSKLEVAQQRSGKGEEKNEKVSDVY
jgi:hypothetical protein